MTKKVDRPRHSLAEREANYKKFALRAAKDLCYSEETIELIKEAKNSIEIERILHDARIKER